jgi:hypothetical protein
MRVENNHDRVSQLTAPSTPKTTTTAFQVAPGGRLKTRLESGVKTSTARTTKAATMTTALVGLRAQDWKVWSCAWSDAVTTRLAANDSQMTIIAFPPRLPRPDGSLGLQDRCAPRLFQV